MRMSDEEFDTVIDTNLAGAFRCARRASKGMIRLRAGGSCSSPASSASTAAPGQTNYAASKAGLVGLARSITRELGGRGITANVVAPGFIETDMTAALPEDAAEGLPGRDPRGPVRHAGGGRRRRALHRQPTRRPTSPAPSSRSTAASAWATDPRTHARHHPHRTTAPTPRKGPHMLLEGKKLLVTGVLMDSSIAFHVAKLAQEQGAEVVLTSFGRTMKITQTIARRLPETPPVVELDVTNDERPRALADRRARARRRTSTASLHSIGFAPQGAFNFLEAAWDDVVDRRAGLGVLAQASLDHGRPAADVRGRQRRRAHLRRPVRLAGLRLDGRGQGRVRVDGPLPRPRPRARRASAATSSRPARSAPPRRSRSRASSSSRRSWGSRAPLGWDVNDPARRPACVRPAVRLVPRHDRRDRARRRRLPRDGASGAGQPSPAH